MSWASHLTQYTKRTKQAARHAIPYMQHQTLCGRSTYSQSVNLILNSVLPLCKSCGSTLKSKIPQIEMVWTASWYSLDPELKTAIRSSAQLDGIRIVLIHSRLLTRMWFIRTKQHNDHMKRDGLSIKTILDMAKLYLDTKWYRSITLQTFIENICHL